MIRTSRLSFGRRALALIFVLVCAVACAQAANCILVTCPNDITVECRGAGARVFYQAQATNACGTNSVVLTCFPASGTVFGVGSIVVRCVATDNLTETNGCTFSVAVRDTTAPEVLCPQEIRVPCQRAGGAVVRFRIGAEDNCDTNLAVTCNPPSESVFPIGTTTVACSTMDDARNLGRCTFPVIVDGRCTAEDDCIDIYCPPDITQVCTNRGGQLVAFSVTASNNCGRVPPTVACVPPSGSIFVLGETVVACTAIGDGGTNRCSFTVTILDPEPPVLTCPPPITTEAQGLDGAVVSFAATATDAWSSNVTVICYPPSGSVFPVGVTRVLCLARDQGGNEVSCIVPVTVRSPRKLELAPHPTVTSQLRLRWFVRGILERTDSLSTPNWRPVTEPVTRNGDERSIDVTRDANVRFYRLAPDPLGPPPDEDRDGVPDTKDICPETPAGRLVDVCGCTPVQVVRDPRALIREPLRLFGELLTELEREPSYTPVRGNLMGLLAFMEADADFLKRGDIASGAERYSNTLVSLLALEQDLEDLRPHFARPPFTTGEADFDNSDDRNLFLDYLAHQLERANAAARVAKACFDRARDHVTETVTITGRISWLTESGKGVILESGEQLEFVSGLRAYDLVPGAEVTVTGVGVAFSGGITLATDIQLMNADEAQTLTKVSLVNLRIAPWQLFSPQGPWLLHHPLAYESNGQLFLERGMRLAAAGNANTASQTLFHALRLELTYFSSGNNASHTTTLASALRHGDKPIEFPSDIRDLSIAILTVTKLHFPKPLAGRRSGAVEILGTESHLIRMRPRYHYARATSSPRVFELEDSPLETAHGVTQVTTVAHEPPLDQYPTAPIFTAQGYKILGAVPSYPSVQTVGEDVSFAIFVHDFFNPDLGPVSEHFNGTPFASGLRWPRVTGQNNGYTYSYACELSKLVRDRIATCGELSDCFNDADSFYRLPFIVGFPLWTMSQGNCGNFTHSGNSQYAYDMVAAAGTEVRAARGGTVIYVEESETQNCCLLGTGDSCLDDCPFGANSVTIEHQDGTVGQYVHMPQNGVMVAVGDHIRRGDPIAVVGNTGFSTGPHLHFVVRKAMGDQSLPSRFQALFSDGTLRNCFRPEPGDPLYSNNKAWYE